MFVKACVAGALALALLPGGLTREDFGPDSYVSHPYVKQVRCEKSLGTAFKIETGQWLSVHHVSSNGGCRIDGKPVFVIHADPVGDFSIIDFGDTTPGGIPIDCSGFVNGEWYWGIGHGWGEIIPQSKAVRYSALDSYWDRGFAVFKGNRFVPGMSGGPVLDKQGKVHGTVNAFRALQRMAISRPLSGTVICSQS